MYIYVYIYIYVCVCVCVYIVDVSVFPCRVLLPVCVYQIESQKLSFREQAKARTDHGADIVVQPDGAAPQLSNTSSPGSLKAAEAPPLDTLADQVRRSPVRT